MRGILSREQTSVSIKKPLRKGRFALAYHFSFLYHDYSRRNEIFMRHMIYANEILKILNCNFKYILSKYCDVHIYTHI